MISVIIPIYNVEAYLDRCLKSICGNTYQDLEILCVNDGSTDGSAAILQRFAKEDPRIRIIEQKNQGVQTARNKGIQESRGEYIAFIDADDFVHAQYFKSLLSCMEQHHADLSICGCIKTASAEKLQNEIIDSIPFTKLSGEQFFNSYYPRHMCWGRLYRKTAIKDVWFDSEVRLGEDTLFNLLVVSRLTEPVVYATDVPLYCYFQRKGSLIRKATYEDSESFTEWVSKNYQSDDQKKWSWMPLMQAIKIGLSARYEANLHQDRTFYRHVQQTLNVLMSRMRKNPQISTKEKNIHLLMNCFPRVYRHYRLKSDPSMKTWERIVNERMRK